jgi:GTP cyclohydrolase IA
MSKSAKNPAITHYPSPIIQEKVLCDRKTKIATIAHHFQAIMETLGLDLQHDSLSKTPERVAKMYVDELFSGLDCRTFPHIELFEEECTSDVGHQSFILTKCNFTSFCEHHFVPMFGYAYVAYLPKDKLVGLSKLHRIVRFFAKRPQLQERLTSQIADSLSLVLEHEDVAVSVIAKHSCVFMRGVHDENSVTTTTYVSGKFKNNKELHQEFLQGVARLENKHAE